MTSDSDVLGRHFVDTFSSTWDVRNWRPWTSLGRHGDVRIIWFQYGQCPSSQYDVSGTSWRRQIDVPVTSESDVLGRHFVDTFSRTWDVRNWRPWTSIGRHGDVRITWFNMVMIWLLSDILGPPNDVPTTSWIMSCGRCGDVRMWRKKSKIYRTIKYNNMIEKNPNLGVLRPYEASVMHISIQIHAYLKWYRSRNQIQHLISRPHTFSGFICGSLFET